MSMRDRNTQGHDAELSSDSGNVFIPSSIGVQHGQHGVHIRVVGDRLRAGDVFISALNYSASASSVNARRKQA